MGISDWSSDVCSSDLRVRSGAWTGWSPSGMLGHRIGGKRLGIIGMGRIGRAVARRAAAFGLSIAYHNRHRLPFEVEQELQAHWHGDLDSLLAGSDIVSIHCPLHPDSRGLLDARRLALLRSYAHLITHPRAE